MKILYENLFGKVVMVTGASSGLGEALARQLVENSCVVYMGARNHEKLKSIADEINNGRGKAIPIALDVTRPEQVAEAAKKMVQEYGKIDVWVNNAGGETPASALELSPQQLYDITAVNYFGLVYGTQEAARQMVKQEFGDIIQVLSTSAFTARKKESAYCGAKSAAKHWSDCVKEELQEYDIRLIHVFPGGMKTKFAENAGLQIPPNAMNPDEVADSILNTLTKPRNVVTDLTLYRKG